MIEITNAKKKIAALISGTAMMANLAAVHACAAGDVASVITNTWNSVRTQVQSIVNNVVFPVLDVILVVLLFVKIAGLYLDYRKHGQLEWAPLAIIFGGLLFSLTAPLYIWSII